MRTIILLSFLVCLCNAQYSFPDDFIFGVATASYQIEGAWNVNGKGENIWDYMTHTFPTKIDDQSNGDTACDAYYKTAEDVQILSNMGVDFYRFSISWSRILPTGHSNEINEDGVRYYNELIDALTAQGIIPLVTTFHWDLPQPLQELGGWTNPLIADYFADYADILYSLFGDRVQHWLTFNEPYQICEQGYSSGEKAPTYTQQGVGGYLCSYTLLLAHAKAYYRYDEGGYRASQNGKVGITISGNWYQPVDESSTEDIEAAENRLQFYFGLYAHPIFSTDGDYPSIVRERIDQLSAEQGFTKSRLPTFTEEEIEYIRGSSDYLGLNLYTTFACTPLADDGDVIVPSYTHDTGAYCYQLDEWESGGSAWMKVTPWGLREHLVWIRDQYNNVEVMITENGYSDLTGQVYDCRRANYYNSYLEELLVAIHEQGCNVSGYAAWSFMDNFEWMRGYTEKFGLYYVDFNDADRPRVPKMSSYVYSNIIATRQIDWNFTPDGFDACDWSDNGLSQ